MWQEIGEKGYIHEQGWPVCDESALVRDEVEIAVQINGKLRLRLVVPSNLGKDQAEEYFLPKEEIKNLIGGKTVRKFVFIPGRLLNIVVG